MRFTLNESHQAGNIVADPELKTLSNDNSVTNFTLVVNERFPKGEDDDGNMAWGERTMFLDMVCWGALGKRLSETVKKGDNLYVRGRLIQDTWEKDGQPMSKIKLNVDKFHKVDVLPRENAEEDGNESTGRTRTNPLSSRSVT